MFERKGRIYSIEEIKKLTQNLLFKEKEESLFDLDGDLIKGNSQRFQTFFTKGIKCCNCGIEGKFFAKEKNDNVLRYHLNLYAIDKDGNEILMTKDHIVPRSKGGKNNISNYQTMCIKCNMLKGNDMQ